MLSLLCDLAMFLGVGMAAPMAALAWMELSQRKQFLHDLASKGMEGMAADFRRSINLAITENVPEGCESLLVRYGLV